MDGQHSRGLAPRNLQRRFSKRGVALGVACVWFTFGCLKGSGNIFPAGLLSQLEVRTWLAM